MYTIYVLTVSSLKMFLRNRQALFFSLFMPLMILVIFGSMNFDKQAPMAVGLVVDQPQTGTQIFLDNLEKAPSLTITKNGKEKELAALKAGDRAAVVEVPNDLISFPAPKDPPKLKIYLNQSQPIEANIMLSIFNQVADRAAMTIAQVQPAFIVEQDSVYVKKMRYIDFLLPGVIAMSVMQMSVFSVAFVFARYREKGILKRLLATPVKPYQFVTANILTRMTMSVAQAAVFAVLGWVIFHVEIAGSIWLLTLCVLLGSVMFLGLGFTISGLAKTTETVPVYSNLIVFPMLFLGNVFFAASNMPAWLRPIANNLPLTYFSRALRAVMTDGAGFWAVKWDLLGTFAWAVVLVTAATLVFRVQEPENA